jgi:hypothetical protein
MMDTYARRVSAEEARSGFLLVEKAKLPFFPPEGEPFLLDGGEARVESYACVCRGPARPHRHWFLRLGGLRAGDEIRIARADATYVRR